jgi:nucleotide-binding universal stress UspA family protein
LTALNTEEFIVERALTDWPMDTSKHRLARVLCAVTFSPSARRVVEWSAALAGSNDAEVRLFHALPNSEELAAALSEGDSERVLKKLFALARSLPGRPRISAAVTEGEAASEILRHARLVKADLIAVGMQAEDGRVSPLVTASRSTHLAQCWSWRRNRRLRREARVSLTFWLLSISCRLRWRPLTTHKLSLVALVRR